MFDVLPGRLATPPDFHPVVVDYKPPPPFDISKITGPLIDALDPEKAAQRKYEAAKRKQGMLQMSMQSDAMKKMASGNYNPDDYEMGSDWMIHPVTKSEKLRNQHLQEEIDASKYRREHAEKVANAGNPEATSAVNAFNNSAPLPATAPITVAPTIEHNPDVDVSQYNH